MYNNNILILLIFFVSCNTSIYTSDILAWLATAGLTDFTYQQVDACQHMIHSNSTEQSSLSLTCIGHQEDFFSTPLVI